MKKQIILGFGLLLCTAMQMEAQKSIADQYLHFSVGVGDHNLSYNLQNGDHSGRAGYSLNAAYSYFFTPQWGVQAGVGIQSFGALSTLNFQSAEPATDSDGDSYVFRDAYKNWQEKQKVLLFEIPIEVQFRHPLNKKVQLQASLGGKVSFPLQTSYKTVGGEMVTTGYYSQWDAELSDLPQHGFSTYTGSYNGHLSLRPAYTAIVDLGGLYKLSDKLDLYVGAYFNYGLNNIQKTSAKLIYQSDGVYNGVLGSNQTSTIRPVAFGIKVGIYWKMEQKRGRITSETSSVAAAQPIDFTSSKKQDIQDKVASTSVNQTVEAPIKTVSINQSIEATQTEASNIGSNKASDVSLSNASEVKSTENNVLESNPENAKVLVETSNLNGGLNKASDVSLSDASGTKSTENNVLERQPENAKVLVETSNLNEGLNKASDISFSDASETKSTENNVPVNKSENAKVLAENPTSNWSLDKARKISHSIILRFEFNDNNSLDTESDKIKTLAETLKANPDLDLLIVNHTHNVASRKINMEVGLKRARLLKKKLVELGVPADQLETDNKGSDKQFINASKKKKVRNRR